MGLSGESCGNVIYIIVFILVNGKSIWNKIVYSYNKNVLILIRFNVLQDISYIGIITIHVEVLLV